MLSSEPVSHPVGARLILDPVRGVWPVVTPRVQSGVGARTDPTSNLSRIQQCTRR